MKHIKDETRIKCANMFSLKIIQQKKLFVDQEPAEEEKSAVKTETLQITGTKPIKL